MCYLPILLIVIKMQLCKDALLLDISLTFASLAFAFKGREM